MTTIFSGMPCFDAFAGEINAPCVHTENDLKIFYSIHPTGRDPKRDYEILQRGAIIFARSGDYGFEIYPDGRCVGRMIGNTNSQHGRVVSFARN